MRRSAVVVAVAVAAAALAAAGFASSRSATVGVRSTPLGRVLVGPNGHSLYMFTADKAKTSACYGQCAGFWPPLIVSVRASAGAGVKTSLLGTTRRKDGKLQVTYNGHPLYFFSGDGKAGDVKGQGIVHFGGSWWLASPAGTKITTTVKTSTTSPPTTTGYGYGS